MKIESAEKEKMKIEIESSKKDINDKKAKIESLENELQERAEFVSPESNLNEINQLKNK